MHTFSCAVQSVDVDGTAVSFAADTGDYGTCTLTIGDNVLTFQRNGLLTGIAKADAPADPEAPAADATTSASEPEPSVGEQT